MCSVLFLKAKLGTSIFLRSYFEIFLISTSFLSLKSLSHLSDNYPANTQHCDNVVVRSQRCKTNTRRCSDVDATMSVLQRCSNVASTLDSKCNLCCTCIDKVVPTLEIATSIAQCLPILDIMTPNLRCINILSTLDSSLSQEHIIDALIPMSRQRWNHNVKFTKYSQRWYYVDTTMLRQLL